MFPVCGGGWYPHSENLVGVSNGNTGSSVLRNPLLNRTAITDCMNPSECTGASTRTGINWLAVCEQPFLD